MTHAVSSIVIDGRGPSHRVTWGCVVAGTGDEGGERGAMATVQLDLADDLLEVLRTQDGSIDRAVRELIVVEWYRRGEISRGKEATELLGMRLAEFLDRAGALDVPYVEYTEDEWAAELASVNDLVRSHQSSPTPVR